MKALDSDIQVI